MVWTEHERKKHDKHQTWKQHSSRIRTELHLPRSGQPWTSKRGVQLLGVGLAQRKLDIIDCAWAARLAESGSGRSDADLARNYWADLAQSVCRRPWSTRLRSFHNRCHIYSYEVDRCLTGTDCMLALGWPKSLIEGSRQADLLALAEGGTSVPLVVALELILWANPWGHWHARAD